jgi:hypothetical protein
MVALFMILAKSYTLPYFYIEIIPIQLAVYQKING